MQSVGNPNQKCVSESKCAARIHEKENILTIVTENSCLSTYLCVRHLLRGMFSIQDSLLCSSLHRALGVPPIARIHMMINYNSSVIVCL